MIIITGGGSNNSYTHTQSNASTIWDIQHNLGFNPNVTVVDSSGQKMLTDVYYTDINNLKIIVANAFAGIAYLS